MYYLILLIFILLTNGCGNQGLVDKEAPKITGVSIETNSMCKKGGNSVPCLLRSIPSGVVTVNVRIRGSDDIGIAGYSILSEDSLVPANWITISSAGTSFDNVIPFDLPSGDGIKTIRVWIKDLGGKISDASNASVLVVSGQIAEWKKESIDAKSDFENGLNSHSLFIDNNGNPEIVYGDNELYSAMFDSTGWAIENIKDASIVSGGSSTGTFIAPDGSVLLSYIDTNNNLIYATNSSGSWIYTTVDGAGSISGFTDITQGPGGINISYYDSAKQALKYASCVSACDDQGNWVLADADNTGDDVGIYSTIKSGSDGSVHIAYFDNTNNAIKYITRDSKGVWSSPVTVDSNTGVFNALSLDSDNKAHIAYYDNTPTNTPTGGLKYATNASGVWVSVDVDMNSSVVHYLSIAVDAGGSVHIAYYDGLSPGLKYASNISGLWVIAILDHNGITGLYNRIAVGSDNKLHISYFDSTNKAVRYAVCAGNCTDTNNWKNVSVTSSGEAGRYNSVIRDPSGNLHVSYIGGRDLRYAENSTGKWRTAIIDESGNIGGCSSMAADSSGHLHIVCDDMENKLLKYATCSNNCIVPENWTFATVEKSATVGFSYVSLAVDADGGLNISYQDIETTSLKYAYCSKDCTDDKDVNGLADNWNKIFIDKITDIDLGKYSSIAAANTGTKKYISYYNRGANANGGDLKVAVCESDCIDDKNGDGLADNWTIETIDEGKANADGTKDSTGLFTSIKTDKNGDAHVSYFNETLGDLMYATNKSGDWVKTAVDKYDTAGVYSALTIGADEKMYIVYYRYSPGLSVLKYAVCDSDCTIDNIDSVTGEGNSDGIGDNWKTYISDEFDNAGVFASIMTDSDSGIHIVYYDTDTGGLNYTFGSGIF